MEEWKIQKDRTKCEKPGCPLSTSSEYYAVLELPSCTRRDLCEPCFREQEAGAEQALLFWRGRRQAKGQKGPVLDLASLRQLFDRLGDEEDPEKVETARGLRYLVALLLLRKRVLKMVDAENPEQEAADLLVIDPKVDDMEPVALSAPDLDSDDMGSLKEELMSLLDHPVSGQAIDSSG